MALSWSRFIHRLHLWWVQSKLDVEKIDIEKIKKNFASWKKECRKWRLCNDFVCFNFLISFFFVKNIKKNWEDCENVYFYKEKKWYFSFSWRHSYISSANPCVYVSGTREKFFFAHFDDLEKTFHTLRYYLSISNECESLDITEWLNFL